jgi:hypothetical protein
MAVHAEPPPEAQAPLAACLNGPAQYPLLAHQGHERRPVFSADARPEFAEGSVPLLLGMILDRAAADLRDDKLKLHPRPVRRRSSCGGSTFGDSPRSLLLDRLHRGGACGGVTEGGAKIAQIPV